MTTLDQLIAEAVAQAGKRRADAIEQACELALQGGVCGVSVFQDRVMVDPAVPFGMIHEHQRPSYHPEGESDS